MKKILKVIIVLAVIFALIFVADMFYSKYNFNDYSKAVSSFDANTSFYRDTKVKYSELNSYCIESPDFNDAAFYKEIEVEKNSAYKVSCMIKTEDVVNKTEVSMGGASISIVESTEKSESVVGTSDWKKVCLYFNSGDRDKVKIAFRLGSFDDMSKGKVWFSDIKLEKGYISNSSSWNMVCFIFKNLDVTLNGEHISLEMSDKDISAMEYNMERFKSSIYDLSKGKMDVDYDIYYIDEPIKSISYDKEHGYYVDPKDVKDIIAPYIEKEDYDYIFSAVRMGDVNGDRVIPVNDWIGLGGMDYLGIGFSNIRLPNDDNNYTYVYNARINQFPEEVFVHEFLHTLERILKENNYNIPALHDYAQYGYEVESKFGLRKWYADYMNCEIETDTGFIGLDSSVYTKKPINNKYFDYATEIEFDIDTNDIIKKVINFFNTVSKSLSNANNEA